MAKKDKTQAPAEVAAKDVTKEEKKVSTTKPEKPDEAARDAALDVIKKEEDEIRGKIAALKEQIDKATEGNDDHKAERQAMWAELKVIDESRKGYKQKREDLVASIKAQSAKQREMKKSERECSDLSEEKIEDEIRALEIKMMTTTCTLKEEKDFMGRIKKLKASRPEAAKKAQELEAMKAENEALTTAAVEGGASVEEQLTKVKEEVKRLTVEHDVIWEKMKGHQDARNEKYDGAKTLIAEKKAFNDSMTSIYERRNEIWTVFKDQNKAFRDFQNAERDARRAKQQAEWAAEQARYDAENAKAELDKPSPYVQEVIRLEGALKFCEDLLPREDKVVEETKEKADISGVIQGAQMITKKNDRDAGFFCKPKEKSKKMKQKKQKTAVVHTNDSLEDFSKMKIAAPVTTADVPETLTAVKKALAAVNAKVAAWEAERKAAIEDAKKKTEETEAAAEADAAPAEA